MLKIGKKFVDRALMCQKPEDLCGLMQNAIELEHSTIPPYLTAMISLKPQKIREIWEVIHSVVLEEMLHMCIAANVMNALEGTPTINKPNFIPKYPGPLPMTIGDGLIVGLERFSKDLVKNVFMEIEEPEDPLEFPVRAFGAAVEEEEETTIGSFYRAIQKKLSELPVNKLKGDPARQVVDHRFFKEQDMFPILTKEDAIRALDVIVKQGEGTTKLPVDPDGDYAHYYRFQELYVGRRLVKDPTSPDGYSFSGPVFPFDDNDIYPIAANVKSADLVENSEQRRQANQFNFVYGKLLNGLHRTFNGDPGFLGATLGLMYDLKLVGERLASMEYPGKPGLTVGPPFEYVNVNQ